MRMGGRRRGRLGPRLRPMLPFAVAEKHIILSLRTGSPEANRRTPRRLDPQALSQHPSCLWPRPVTPGCTNPRDGLGNQHVGNQDLRVAQLDRCWEQPLY